MELGKSCSRQCGLFISSEPGCSNLGLAINKTQCDHAEVATIMQKCRVSNWGYILNFNSGIT